jgi:hypothetical protein
MKEYFNYVALITMYDSDNIRATELIKTYIENNLK